eukprot:5119354-Pyramimonas_sp.AAC.1
MAAAALRARGDGDGCDGGGTAACRGTRRRRPSAVAARCRGKPSRRGTRPHAVDVFALFKRIPVACSSADATRGRPLRARRPAVNDDNARDSSASVGGRQRVA